MIKVLKIDTYKSEHRSIIDEQKLMVTLVMSFEEWFDLKEKIKIVEEKP